MLFFNLKDHNQNGPENKWQMNGIGSIQQYDTLPLTKSQKYLAAINYQQQPQQPQQAVQYNESIENGHSATNTTSSVTQTNSSAINRKSASMESIPSGTAAQFMFNNTYSYMNGTPGTVSTGTTTTITTKNTPNAALPLANAPGNVVNVYKKFGTVNGALSSTSANSAAGKQTRPTLFVPSFTNQNGNESNGADQLAANSRLRPINRSFRTAVDKSFDMPSNSGKQTYFSSWF
jgi:hypothetical protein